MRSRWTAAIGIVMVVAVLAIVGTVVLSDRGDDEESAGGDGVASGSPSPTPSASPFDPADRRVTSWGTELINIEAPMETDGGRRVQVYFVSEGSHATLLSKARKCVREYLKDFRAAACYAFDSEEALIYADVAEDGGMAYLCWRAFVSAAREVDRAERIEDGQYEVEGCPDVFAE